MMDKVYKKEESNRLYKNLKTTPDMVVFFTDKGRVLNLNKKVKLFLGFSSEAALSDINFFDFFSVKSKNKLTRKILPEVISSGYWQGELTIMGKEKQEISSWQTIILHKESETKQLYFSMVTHDISYSKEMKKQINSLSHFPNANPQPVLRISNKGILLYFNYAAECILKDQNFYLKKTVSAKWLSFIQRAVQAEKVIEIEEQIEEKFFLFSLTPILSQKYVNIYGIDITKQKKLELLLEEYKEKLENKTQETIKELKPVHDNLPLGKHHIDPQNKDQKTREGDFEKAKHLANIGSLAAAVAHELRNPLGVIRTATYNIRQKRTNPSIDKQLYNIEKKILEGNQVITNLLQYSKLKPAKFQKININSLCLEAIDHAREYFHATKIELRHNINLSDKFIITADPLQISVVINNIIINAYQAFSDITGQIKFTVIYPDEQASNIEIQVNDTGIGIGKTDLGKIFTPFFSNKAKGTGLGLTICNEIINLHEGTINVISKKGSGTTVSIKLPISR